MARSKKRKAHGLQHTGHRTSTRPELTFAQVSARIARDLRLHLKGSYGHKVSVQQLASLTPIDVRTFYRIEDEKLTNDTRSLHWYTLAICQVSQRNSYVIEAACLIFVARRMPFFQTRFPHLSIDRLRELKALGFEWRFIQPIQKYLVSLYEENKAILLTDISPKQLFDIYLSIKKHIL